MRRTVSVLATAITFAIVAWARADEPAVKQGDAVLKDFKFANDGLVLIDRVWIKAK